ncbi:DUF6507 family protein [Nocardiopsis sp. NPDC055551]|uniref:DUF6507 family protein n=1 Tax=Nocardiopsis listeri TaxID=53440 RepID=UPI00082E0DFC|nr:DUF6507 family protein [Nocardiopsis listeri]
MSEWDVDPTGVGGVLHNVADQVGDGGGEALDGHLTSLANSLVEAAGSSMSGPVGSELYALLEHVGEMCEEMVGRAGSAVEGCAEAVDAFLVGDMEMAAEAQSAAGTIDDPA